MVNILRTLVVTGLWMLPLYSAAEVTGTENEAQTTATVEEQEPKQELIPVRKGKARVGKLVFPVYTEIKSVEKSSFDGIRYTITEKSAPAALAKARKIKAFYKGKKLGSATFGRFRKFGSPQRNAWYAAGKAGNKRRIVAIIVNENEITVQVIPDGDDQTLSLLL